MAKKRILFISESASSGGAPTIMQHNILALNKTKYEIHALFGKNGPCAKTLEPSIQVHYYSYKPLVPFLTELQKIYYKNYSLQRSILKKINTIKPEIIVHNGPPPLLFLSLYAQINIPVISHLHGLSTGITEMYPNYIDTACSTLHSFVSCSVDTSNVAVDLLNIPSSKIKTIYNGVNFSHFYKVTDEARVNAKKKLFNCSPQLKVIGSAGSFSSNKGIDLFIQVAEKIIQKTDQFRFVWYGDFTVNKQLYKGINSYLKKKRIDQYFFFPGLILEKDTMFHALDYFISCSRLESFGLALLESMAFGIPAFTVRVGGMPEVLPFDEQLFYLEDSSGMANAILSITNETEIERIQTKQFMHIHKMFDIDKKIIQWEEVFDHV